MAGTLRRLWYGDLPALTAAAPPRRRALTSAATQVMVGRDPITPRYDQWQDEAWGYWQELGEVYYGVRWLSEMLSRIRLVAAEAPDDPGDEPVLYEGGGTPVDLLERFAGGMGGQAEILRRLTVQLSVPGEGWLVGEPNTSGGSLGDRWTVRSADEIRQARRRPDRTGINTPVAELPRRGGSALSRLAGNGRDYGIEVVDETTPPGGQQRWRVLDGDALVVRIWNPHDRRYREADSPVRHALSTARRLQLANRYIQAQFLSRLASAGLIVLSDDIDFPVREEFEGMPDGVMRELIAVAQEAIQNPGSAASIIPILMQLPPDVIDKIKFIDFTTAFDAKILEKREAAVRELASIMDVPAEILTGMGEVNHWSAWQLEEGGIKVHIAPRMEMICHAFTDGWYRPMLKAAGEDPSKFLVWYDPSEIVVRPDKSEKALVLYDRGEVGGDALRRESGLDEGDKPEGDDLKEWALKQLVLGKGGEALVPVAYKELTGEELQVPAPAAPEVPGRTPEQGTEAEGGEEAADVNERREPPGTQSEPPPAPGEGEAPARAAAVLIDGLRDERGWPLQKREDGWYVYNVSYWTRCPEWQQSVIEGRWRELAMRMTGHADEPAAVNGKAEEEKV
jgi:hypothetical protein